MMRVSDGGESECEAEGPEPFEAQEEPSEEGSAGQEESAQADPLRAVRRSVQTQIQHELLNRMEMNDRKIGIISSGISYQHAREAFGESASYLKLGITHPLPEKLIRDFCGQVEKVIVIEEGEPYLEEAVKALGIFCEGKIYTTRQGELSAARLRAAFGLGAAAESVSSSLTAPPRPPALCAGCPHRGFYFAMQNYHQRLVAVGDIGCYSLGVGATRRFSTPASTAWWTRCTPRPTSAWWCWTIPSPP